VRQLRRHDRSGQAEGGAQFGAEGVGKDGHNGDR
jgi:hypothetical protein